MVRDAGQNPRQRDRVRVRGTPDQLRRIRYQDQPRRQRADSARRQTGERIAYLGKNSDIYFELLLGAMKANVVMAPVNWRLAGPEIAFIVGDCKAPVLFVGPEFVAQVRTSSRNCPMCAPSSPPKAARPDGETIAAWRDAQSGDDPEHRDQPAGHRDPALHLRHDRQAERRDAVARQFSQSGADRQGAKSPTGTNGPRTTSRWWRCRSSISAVPAGA